MVEAAARSMRMTNFRKADAAEIVEVVAQLLQYAALLPW